jgi:hypothetical protein
MEEPEPKKHGHGHGHSHGALNNTNDFITHIQDDMRKMHGTLATMISHLDDFKD